MRTFRQTLGGTIGLSFLMGAAPTSMPSTPDQTFAMASAKDGLKEVTMGRLAMTQADSPAVRDLGRMIVADHERANDRLLTITMQEGLGPPKSLPTEDQTAYDALSGLRGKAFDRAYVKGVVADHEQDIPKFQHEVMTGSDPAIKDWARSTLPVLQHHLAAAQNVAGQMGG